MKFESPTTMQIASPEGARVSIDLGSMKMRRDQKAALTKIIRGGGPSGLTRKEWESVKDLKARIGGAGGDVALIVRFDCKWVRIDESALSFEQVVKNPA